MTIHGIVKRYFNCHNLRYKEYTYFTFKSILFVLFNFISAAHERIECPTNITTLVWKFNQRDDYIYIYYLIKTVPQLITNVNTRKIKSIKTLIFK